jgi:hypothetical protein
MKAMRMTRDSIVLEGDQITAIYIPSITAFVPCLLSTYDSGANGRSAAHSETSVLGNQ